MKTNLLLAAIAIAAFSTLALAQNDRVRTTRRNPEWARSTKMTATLEVTVERGSRTTKDGAA